MVEKQGNQAAGEKQGRKPWTLREFGGKTLWDWLQLLIVPVVLSLITVVFAWQQDIRQDQIENKRAEAERELASERAQDEALQAYLNQMSGLLLERDLRASEEDSEVRTLARARTLTVLGRLDPTRKSAVLQFLVEAELLQRIEGRGPIIKLSGANLSGARLSHVNLGDLGNISLSRPTNLSGADLSYADLSNADLRGADLSNANLSGTDLNDANLSGYADLSDANLSKANLSKANLSNATLVIANLSGTDLRYADLIDANLSPWVHLHGVTFVGGVTDLSNADLRGAVLRGAHLFRANLSGANLSGADLSKANLSKATGVSEEELEEQAKTLKGAIMPDGSIHH